MMDETIAAIATAVGEGGLAVIRVSGRDALTIADRCFQPSGRTSTSAAKAASHTIQYGRILQDGRVVDEVLVSVMRAPRTYTREDVVEISCHGGVLPARLVLEAVLAGGARLAEPGEFTRRAFLNGRIDLAQAEAVADLIHSRTELALRAANEQLAGKLSGRINALRDRMMQALSHLEAHIDFPEEDILPDTRERLIARLDEGIRLMEDLLRTADEGRILRRGIRAAIVGPPNAGKSSLLNQLLGHDRAIVSASPGTTRDTIEETANIRGLPILFIDTAGLRQARDDIEKEGIRRSRLSYERAELLLQVVDGSEPTSAELEASLVEFSGRKRILVRNKMDLPQRLRLPADLAGAVVELSCVTGEGIETLKDAIRALVWSGQVSAAMLEAMINARHQDALDRARAAAIASRDALREGRTPELVALDLRIAVQAIGEVVGQTATEDLLDCIFSQFCIGK